MNRKPDRSLVQMGGAVVLGLLAFFLAPVEQLLQREDIDNLTTGRHWSYGINRLAFLKVEESRRRDVSGDTWLVGSSIGNSLFPPSTLERHQLSLYYPYGRPVVLEPWLEFSCGTLVFLLDPQMLLGPVVPEPERCQVNLERRRELWRLAFHAILPGALGSEEQALRQTLEAREAGALRSARRRREIEHLMSKMHRRGDSSGITGDLERLVAWHGRLKSVDQALKVVILPVPREFLEAPGSPARSNLQKARTHLLEGFVPLLDLSEEKLDEEQFVDWGHYSPRNPANEELRRRILNWCPLKDSNLGPAD